MSVKFLSPPARILILKPSAIGDVVHALPVLNLLRKTYPQSHIAWLVTPACAGLLEGHPQLNEIIRFDRKGYAKGYKSLAALKGLISFVRSLREQRFDLVLDLQGLFRSGWLAWQTRAAYRVGFKNAREGAPLFYTHRIDVGTAEQHAIERYLTLAQAVGCPREPVEYVFAVDDEDRRHVASLVPDRYAVLMPGANWHTKRWPAERFAAVVGPLKQRFGLESVIAGGADAEPLAALAPSAVNLAGKTNLRQVVALLERAALVIANDTGPMHIAAALNRPLVTPYGPTNPVRTGPHRRDDSVIRLDIACSPCYSRKCSHTSCLYWLEIEPVLELAREQLGHTCHL
jgi:lipopolysaccharide heptosyltransferase I